MSEYSYSPETGFRLKAGFGFKTVWVIESLPAGEYRSGKELYDDVLYYNHVQDPELLVRFQEIENRKDFEAVLGCVLAELESTGKVPLLHFDVHGNQEGLQLTSGEFVTYAEMFPLFQRINIRTQNNLFVVVAACHGGYLVSIVNPAERSPFWGVLGPSEVATGQDLFMGYKAFYETALAGESLNKAMDSLRAALPRCGDKFCFYNSEHLFMRAFRRYVDQGCRPESVEKRIKDVLTKAQVEMGLDPVTGARFAADIRKRLADPKCQKEVFNCFRKRFFFHDLYPGNEELPMPSYEDAMRLEMYEEPAADAPME